MLFVYIMGLNISLFSVTIKRSETVYDLKAADPEHVELC